MSCIEKATPPPPQERHLYNPPDCLRFISVSIEFFPNHYSCKVNSSLCTKNESSIVPMEISSLYHVIVNSQSNRDNLTRCYIIYTSIY